MLRDLDSRRLVRRGQTTTKIRKGSNNVLESLLEGRRVGKPRLKWLEDVGTINESKKLRQEGKKEEN
jgi:hypothetical protein